MIWRKKIPVKVNFSFFYTVLWGLISITVEYGNFLGKTQLVSQFFLPIFCLYPVAMSNVLFSPRAKHEIGHFSWQRHLRQKGKNHVLRSSYLKEISFDLLHFPRLKHIKFLKNRTRTLWRSINQLNIEEAIFQLAFGNQKNGFSFFPSTFSIFLK